MNIGYLLFMGLLCTTLALWAIVAIRDDSHGAAGDSQSPEDLSAEARDAVGPAVEDDDDSVEGGGDQT